MDIYALTSQETLERISRHCPEALSVYLHCLNRCDGDNNIFFTKQMIDVDLSEEFKCFKNNIKKLARENLLSWLPIDKGIAVKLIRENDE